MSWQMPVRASRSESREYGPDNLTDGDPETWWSAADGGPQWFEVDLRRPATIGSIRLPIGTVTPKGRVDIRVLVKGLGTNGKYRQVHRFQTRIKSGDVLEHSFSRPVESVRFVRVVVEDMDDQWVILHDVEIWRAH